MSIQFNERAFVETVKLLSSRDQQMLLDLANRLARPHGTPGSLLIARAKDFEIDPADLQRMSDAIEEAFEQPEDFPEVNFDE